MTKEPLIEPKKEDTVTNIIPVLQALLVTFLWSSSWILIKFGLSEIGPLIYAGLRYSIASSILIFLVLIKPTERATIRQLKPIDWGRILLYGFIFVTLTQGAQFVGLSLLPAITVSMMLNFTAIVVVIMGIFLIDETPNRKQVICILISIIGAFVYFYSSIELEMSDGMLFGIIIVIICVISNALSKILGRSLNRSKNISPLIITAISMFFGSMILLIAGLIIEGLPEFSFVVLAFILWLAVVNTAFAFTLWNHAMRSISAVEITVINNTMLVQITLLAVLFLNEFPTLVEWLGLVIIAISALLVQVLRNPDEGFNKVDD